MTATDETDAHLMQPWPVAARMGGKTGPLIASGDGVYIVGSDGRRLIDGPAGMWCVNAGHRNAALIEAMAAQATALTYNSPWYTMNEPSVLLAARLAAHAPGDLKHAFFTTGGSTAVETALRFMQFYNNVRGRPQKKKIVSRDRSYHGSTYLAASLNGQPRNGSWMDFASDLTLKLQAPDPFRRPKGQTVAEFCDVLIEEFRTTIAAHGADTIGALVADPVMASGGVVVPPDGYLTRMRALCTEHDILYISDEVVTAFGRTGQVFASKATFGIEPDMITFAKGVTSGYFPFGGVMISARLMQDLRGSNHPEAMFAHGLTYSSHPIGCAVALKNLDLLEGGLLDHAQAMGPIFQSRLKTLEDLPLVGEVRGVGLMAGVECVADRDSLNPLRLDTEVGKRIDRHCHELGLLVRPIIHMCVMSPPLVITEAQIEELVAILREGIRRTQDDLLREGLWRG